MMNQLIFFIGDDAFLTSKNLMKSYSGTNLGQKKRIFNYRLSRARRTIENAFGILVSHWRDSASTHMYISQYCRQNNFECNMSP